MLMAAISLGATASGGSLPTFADSYYVGKQVRTIVNQGGYTFDNGVCCSDEASACKIQTVSLGSDVREQVSHERTRADSNAGSLVTWFGSVRKQMAVVPGAAVNSTNKWACVECKARQRQN